MNLCTLVQIRLRGERPIGGVIVTNDYHVRDVMRRKGFFVLLVDFQEAPDMRPLVGLDVGLVYRYGDVTALGQAILAADPRTFIITQWGKRSAKHQTVLSGADHQRQRDRLRSLHDAA